MNGKLDQRNILCLVLHACMSNCETVVCDFETVGFGTGAVSERYCGLFIR